jgi:DNA-binding ferritin-like protein
MGKDSLHAIWVDPLAFEALRNGPPYLPEGFESRLKMAADSVDPVLPKLMGMFPKGMEMAELGALVAVLRAASIIHQTHHWRSSGSSFYGDHLLFERLYNDSVGFIDQVAERSVGSGNRALVDARLQANLVHALINYWCSSADADDTDLGMIQESLSVEHCVLGCLKSARYDLDQKGQLSDGTDNLLQGVSDKHEEFVYLLQQRAGVREASAGYDFR